MLQTISFDEGWIMDAANGTAPRAVQVFVACHNALNPVARSTFARAEAVMSSMFEHHNGEALCPGALDRALSQIEHAVPTDLALTDEPNGESHYPAALQQALEESSSKTWRKRFGGYSEIVLDSLCEPGVQARLLSIPQGRGAPEHDHGAEEGTLVLSGSFYDGHGQFKRGDACIVQPGTVHHPKVDSEEDCICLAVELGELKLTNPVYSTIQRALDLFKL